MCKASAADQPTSRARGSFTSCGWPTLIHSSTWCTNQLEEHCVLTECRRKTPTVALMFALLLCKWLGLLVLHNGKWRFR